MSNEYPRDEELKRIREWNIANGGQVDLLDYAQGLWHNPGFGFLRYDHRLELHTGGWSGNEDIIAALRANYFFWTMYWQEYRRGGHYVFDDSGLTDSHKGFVGRPA